LPFDPKPRGRTPRALRLQLPRHRESESSASLARYSVFHFQTRGPETCVHIECDRIDKIQSHLAVAARGQMSVIQEHVRGQSMWDICHLVTLAALICDDALHAAGQ